MSKLVATPFYTLKGLGANIRVYSEEEYKTADMEVTDKINSHTIPFSFFKYYLEREGKTLDTLKEKSHFIVFDTYKMMWDKASVITVIDAREWLHALGLDYDPFIEEYCKYLKTVNF